MEELEIRTKKIKLFNNILIGLMFILLFILLPMILGSGDEDDTSALIAIPVAIIGSSIISALIFELIDLKINRSFYQVKAMINSALVVVPLLFFLIAVGSDGTFVFDIIIVALCGLFIYHGLLARNDLKSNYQKINTKYAVLTTVGLILTIPVLMFLLLFIGSLFR